MQSLRQNDELSSNLFVEGRRFVEARVEGQTALHYAILTEKTADLRTQCVAYLLQHGAKLDVKDWVRNVNYTVSSLTYSFVIRCLIANTLRCGLNLEKEILQFLKSAK